MPIWNLAFASPNDVEVIFNTVLHDFRCFVQKKGAEPPNNADHPQPHHLVTSWALNVGSFQKTDYLKPAEFILLVS